jgi:hypothetical protein
MARRPTPEPDDPEQSERFIKAAKEIEATEDEKEAERAFTRVVLSKRRANPHQN